MWFAAYLTLVMCIVAYFIYLAATGTNLVLAIILLGATLFFVTLVAIMVAIMIGISNGGKNAGKPLWDRR